MLGEPVPQPAAEPLAPIAEPLAEEPAAAAGACRLCIYYALSIDICTHLAEDLQLQDRPALVTKSKVSATSTGSTTLVVRVWH